MNYIVTVLWLQQILKINKSVILNGFKINHRLYDLKKKS